MRGKDFTCQPREMIGAWAHVISDIHQGAGCATRPHLTRGIGHTDHVVVVEIAIKPGSPAVSAKMKYRAHARMHPLR